MSGGVGVEERSSKRRRLDTPTEASASNIQSSGQLHQLLRFNQSTSPDVKLAVNQFKDFLASIPRNQDVSAQSRQFRILRQYCDAQAATSGEGPTLSDLVSTWSFAAQSNNDSICSAVPAALAQFYKTISGILEFRDFGLSLGHNLLKRDQARLFDRGLSASKSKDHVISPCLRLLTELVSFDGGTLAPLAWGRKDLLYRRIDHLLDHHDAYVETDRRRPSVRRMALRLIIANLRFLDTAAAKTGFVTQGRLLRNCFRGLLADGDDIVVDVLKAIDTGLIEDLNIARVIKSRIFNQESLAMLATLYDYEDLERPEATIMVREVLHEVLLKLCTTRKGILLMQTGWYPVAFDTKLEETSDRDFINLGLDSPLHIDEYSVKIQVKNAVLLIFAQGLRPEKDTLQSSLLLRIFQSAPELVAEYFNKKTKLAASTEDDSTWRSEFAFLFSVSQLSVPKNFGWQDGEPSSPPPAAIMIESIIPRPLDKASLSKYLTSDEDVLVLSAARLLIVALEKLGNVVRSLVQKKTSEKWQQAATLLVKATLARVPKVQEIVNSLQRNDREKTSVRLSLLECLSAYHRILPEAVAGSKFDFGATIGDVLSRSESQEIDSNSQDAVMEQLTPLVAIAHLSSATRWWHKQDAESMSLFGRVLRFSVYSANETAAPHILSVLEVVADQAGFLALNKLSFKALEISVASTKKFKMIYETWLMLDNAIHHATQKPVKYIDSIETAQRDLSDKKPLSVLAAAVVEQWKYILKKHQEDKPVLKNIAEWITRFYSALDSVGENFRVLQQFQDDILQSSYDKAAAIFQKSVGNGHKKPVTIDVASLLSKEEIESTASKTGTRSLNLNDILGTTSSTTHGLEGIDRWDDQTDIELAIRSGKITRLLRCTSSPEEEIRRQTFQALQSLLYVVHQSNHDEKVQLHLLLGEVTQTIRQRGISDALPRVASELAIRLLQILSDPAHKMYGKVNKFLLRSPTWELKRIISYWTREILFHEPESDDASSWSNEIEWFVQWLVDGLQSSTDMEIYRRSGIFEKVLSVYTKPDLPRSIRKLILTLIWRGINTHGATTLLTRVGIRDWLQMVGRRDKEHHAIIRQLEKDLGDHCDTDLISVWKQDLPVLRQEN